MGSAPAKRHIGDHNAQHRSANSTIFRAPKDKCARHAFADEADPRPRKPSANLFYSLPALAQCQWQVGPRRRDATSWVHGLTEEDKQCEPTFWTLVFTPGSSQARVPQSLSSGSAATAKAEASISVETGVFQKDARQKFCSVPKARTGTLQKRRTAASKCTKNERAPTGK